MAKKCRRSRESAALKLNGELLKSIVSKCLPLQSIFRLRCVCKTWRTLLADDCLEDIFEILSQKPLWCTIPSRRADHDLAAYDVGMKCWHKWRSTLHMKYFSLYDVLGDAGSWLLVQESSTLCQSSRSLWLANPAKKVFRRLPNVLEGREEVLYATGLGVDGSSKACRVFAVDRLDSGAHKVYSYNFELDSWEALGAWHADGRETIHSMTLYEGTLLCFRSVPTSKLYTSVDVCYFNGTGWQAHSPKSCGANRFDHLFQWQGHLMMISEDEGEQRRGCDYILAGVTIWQHDMEKSVWVESTTMPDHMVDHLILSNGDESSFNVTCVTSGDQICVTSRTTVKEDAIYKCKSRHVMCDLSKGLWWEVPEPTFQYEDVSRFSVLIPNLAFHHGFRKL